ncbi:MAG TPA: UDP-N-acetylmuramoyl-L-alanyl-D-glutamate--2,6-diaminopimelate ligase [Pseudonocardiaceae bacterium]|nr:UDP-N-acetylmuramoyl-L-alanyl-D-glutamate--2,6-diaminopimelate ligase [Pseudonocardiaceae bacterium]
MPNDIAETAPPRPSTTRPVPVAELAGLARLTQLAGPSRRNQLAGGAVTGVTLRASEVRPGDLFAALPGSRAHGADFAADALAAGAAALLTDPAGAARPAVAEAVAESRLPVLVHENPRAVLGRLATHIYGDPSARLSVVGVTGTSGKTTTSFLIEAGLSGAGGVTGLIGTVQTTIAGERLGSAFTTPEAPDLQALLALMVERGVTHVAMEVSSHALAQGRVDGTRFAVGAFTNLSPEHLDFHPDMEAYFAAKAMLFDGRAAAEVVCVDTEWGRRLVTDRTVTVSTTGERADWWVGAADADPTGAQSFEVHGPDGLLLPVSTRLPGRFNAANTALALACVRAAGADVRLAVPAIAAVDVAGRMERVRRGQDFVAIIDYAHKPAAVAAVLDAVRAQHPAARLAVVVGCGGDRDRAKRPVMGAEAARRADLLVVTDDNPRTEDPAAIRAAMLTGALDVPSGQRGEVTEIGDRRQAIRAAVAWAGPGDVVVIAGKGHEAGQEIDGVKYPFSDRDELVEAIDARLGGARPDGCGTAW